MKRGVVGVILLLSILAGCAASKRTRLFHQIDPSHPGSQTLAAKLMRVARAMHPPKDGRDFTLGVIPSAELNAASLASQFERGGAEGPENPQLFQTPEVKTAGGCAALQAAGNPRHIGRETVVETFAA